MQCGHVLLFHVNLMHIVFVAFNLRMFRLWFTYRYAQEKLAQHQDPGFKFSSFSKISVADRGSGGDGGSSGLTKANISSANDRNYGSSQGIRQRFCDKHRRRSNSQWFHTHRSWVKTRTLLVLLVIISVALMAATNFWYIASSRYDPHARDPDCLAFDEIRPLATVLAGE